jgi:hypothetical protein
MDRRRLKNTRVPNFSAMQRLATVLAGPAGLIVAFTMLLFSPVRLSREQITGT